MRQITYHIHRYQQGRAFVQTFKFDYEADRTILWGLQKIKDTQDPTLTFLAACRSAVCGACSVRVNGEAMLGCEAKIDELTERYGTDELTIAPIGNFRVIRDLVVDWEAKVDRLKTVAPWIFLKAEFNEGDKVMTGKTFDAPWAGGFGTTFAWKGLSLSAQFSWMADRWVMNNDRFFEESNGLYSTYNQSRRLLYDRWKKPGDITDIPRYGVTAQLDDRFLENSSFLRLKNLTLAYALPQPLLKKTNFFTSARVYLQGQNLLTFTGFTGLDPEMSSNIYRAQYPASRQFTLGIEVSF